LPRRGAQPTATPSQVELGDLCYSPARGIASVGGAEVSLTLSEGRILEALLAQPGEPMDKQALAQHALGRKLTLYDRSLDMHVSNLRRKLGPHATATRASWRCAAVATFTLSDRLYRGFTLG